MYLLNDRNHYIRKSLDNKLFEEKMKQSLIPGANSIYIDENLNILNFTKSNNYYNFVTYKDSKLLKYASKLRKYYSLELVSNKETFKILSGYIRESNFFKNHQECLTIHTKSMVLFSKTRNTN